VLNNVGYSLVGTVEEASDTKVRAVFDANFFQRDINIIPGMSRELATERVPILSCRLSGSCCPHRR